MNEHATATAVTTTEAAAVRAVLEQAYRAWADNDADAFAALYTADATVVMPGVFHADRAALHSYLAAGFAGPLKGSRAVDDEQSLRVLGDTAIVVSRSLILFAGEPDQPADADARAVTATWVLARTDAGWQITAYANAPAAS
jgi:uncharacterized protein (TIGR02246 family)